jgi:hypothetical protein
MLRSLVDRAEAERVLSGPELVVTDPAAALLSGADLNRCANTGATTSRHTVVTTWFTVPRLDGRVRTSGWSAMARRQRADSKMSSSPRRLPGRAPVSSAGATRSA